MSTLILNSIIVNFYVNILNISICWRSNIQNSQNVFDTKFLIFFISIILLKFAITLRYFECIKRLCQIFKSIIDFENAKMNVFETCTIYITIFDTMKIVLIEFWTMRNTKRSLIKSIWFIKSSSLCNSIDLSTKYVMIHFRWYNFDVLIKLTIK